MGVLKFELNGKTAFFKKPDVNTYMYFSYGNIHKVALLGLLGAIVGYNGYNQMMDAGLPEFYSRLKDIKLSIVPKTKKGTFTKKLQVFNNSTGFNNKDNDHNPCNLIVREQWLENPAWDIYIIIDGEESKKIADYILNSKSIYQTYLGKNDHLANITNVAYLDENIQVLSNVCKIDSLFIKEGFAVQNIDNSGNELLFKYEEMLPVALDYGTYMYLLKSFVYTNHPVEMNLASQIYAVNDMNLFFY